jgi:hypothetical protein
MPETSPHLGIRHTEPRDIAGIVDLHGGAGRLRGPAAGPPHRPSQPDRRALNRTRSWYVSTS